MNEVALGSELLLTAKASRLRAWSAPSRSRRAERIVSIESKWTTEPNTELDVVEGLRRERG